jgi:hypothetical protein
MKPRATAFALRLATTVATLGLAHALAGEDRLRFPHGEAAKSGQLLAWPAPVQTAPPPGDFGQPPTRVTPVAETPSDRGVKPPLSPPATPLILPRAFAPQPVHRLLPGERVGLKPWPDAAPTAGLGLPPAALPLSLQGLAQQVLASLPSQGGEGSARPRLPPPITLAGDNGGWLQDYYERFRSQVAKGATFRIDGRCASACTLVLAYWDRVCVTKRAVLGFHEARNRDGTRNQRVTDNMMAAYPVPVRDYISAHGGLPAPTNMMWVSGAALRGLLKPCE